MYGGLGQDDMIGGSSDLFGLTATRGDAAGWRDTDLSAAPASDIAQRHRDELGDRGRRDGSITTVATGHARDADFIVGDNANVYRLVERQRPDQFLAFNYDTLRRD